MREARASVARVVRAHRKRGGIGNRTKETWVAEENNGPPSFDFISLQSLVNNPLAILNETGPRSGPVVRVAGFDAGRKTHVRRASTCFFTKNM